MFKLRNALLLLPRSGCRGPKGERLLPLCASSHWQTCKPGAVLGLGRAGFMARALSLPCTILLSACRPLPPGAPICQLFPQGAVNAPSTLVSRGGCYGLPMFTVLSVRAESRGPFRHASECAFPKNYRAAVAPGRRDINQLDL